MIIITIVFCDNIIYYCMLKIKSASYLNIVIIII